MSYAQAVKKINSKDSEIRTIRSQAETELGKELNETEESLLLSRFNQEQLCDHIQKVHIQSLYLFDIASIYFFSSVWIWCS